MPVISALTQNGFLSIQGSHLYAPKSLPTTATTTVLRSVTSPLVDKVHLLRLAVIQATRRVTSPTSATRTIEQQAVRLAQPAPTQTVASSDVGHIQGCFKREAQHSSIL